jgi:hypothetical protein
MIIFCLFIHRTLTQEPQKQQEQTSLTFEELLGHKKKSKPYVQSKVIQNAAEDGRRRVERIKGL